MVHRASLFVTGRMGQMSCSVLFTSIHIFLMGFMSGVHSGQSMRLTPAGSIALLELYMNHESRRGQVATGLLSWYKAVLQQTSLHSSKCAYTEDCLVACYMMKHFSHFIGDPASTVDK
jgi:hypothetical protein